MAEAADYYGVSAMTIRRLLEKGILKGKQVVSYAPWIIDQEELEKEHSCNNVRSI